MADRFARIAKTKVTPREKIAEVQPRQFRERIISLDACSGEPLPVPKKADTKEELQKLLAAERKAYQPFLSDHAPAIASHREKIAVENFTVDGEPVTLPHYGGPTGYAKKVYKAQFVLDKKEDGQLYYICFGGVDYIAVVSVNGRFVGRHEGFFSPFSFEITDVCRPGLNELCVEVENDCVYAGNEDENGREVLEGDKLYAATGLGWDDPVVGWHHCPPGMGIWGDVHVERRNREYIADLYVRPDPENGFAEIWVDAYSADYDLKMLRIDLCICGKNFEDSALEKASFETRTQDGQYLCRVGLEGRELFCKKGLNEYRIRVPMKDFRLWQPDAPYLYEAQAALVFDGQEKDTARRQFGMRSFRQDTVSKKKGMFYLNGRALKLRGANTMGFEQQDVLRRDFEQLIDDILLAKICHMNFWRLTQRPVQEQVYEYCDKLGLMTQTDLPLFGVMRRTRYAEGVRQAEEMERIIRSHPCNVVVSLINEPTANGGDEPHRHLRRPELEQFFESCASVIRILNPDRVLKYVDGDYDPPSSNMPDNHCYNQWYNGHTIDAGKMHKGYWCAVKPGWYYGCGEFGIEG
ncbi:MAG: glycoside hydrolase family 2, partial [Clostridia bacterium]|nr:glycoside hydrolase family 2 [Clostridia bacterium]